jgi:large-conductance mechanosensitive channel
MGDFLSELIGFSIVAIVVIMLAFFTSKLEKRFKDENKKD